MKGPGTDTVEFIITAIAAIVALAVAAILPLGYFHLSYAALSAAMQTKAEVKADIASELVGRSPGMWKFETVRLREMLERHPLQLAGESAEAFDQEGTLVVHTGATPAAPVLTRAAPMFDAGSPVGRVEVGQSLRPLWLRTLLAGLAGLALGTGILLRFA